MQFVLPFSKTSVEFLDFVPQAIEDEASAPMYKKIKAVDTSWKRVTKEDIAEILGTDVLDRIDAEEDEERKALMMKQAQKEVAASDPKKGGASMYDLRMATQRKTGLMIVSATDKNGKDADLSTPEKKIAWAAAQATPDYDFLVGKLNEVEATMDEFLKAASEQSAQS